MKQYSVLSVDGNVADETGAILLETLRSNVANTATGFLQLPRGTTAQRPSTPLDGMRRYNTTTLRDEFYANGAWRNHARLEGDTFTGNVGVTGNLSATNMISVGTSVANPTSGALVLSRNGGQFFIENTAGATNEKLWDILNNTTTLRWRAVNDANNAATNYFEINRTGLTINTVCFPNGNVGIGASTASQKLTVVGNVLASQFRISALNTAPASASATGTLGEIRYDADYMYVCVATNTWKRSPLTTW